EGLEASDVREQVGGGIVQGQVSLGNEPAKSDLLEAARERAGRSGPSPTISSTASRKLFSTRAQARSRRSMRLRGWRVHGKDDARRLVDPDRGARRAPIGSRSV